MALIEVYHTIASYKPLASSFDASSTPITEGMAVRLDTSGNVLRGTSSPNVCGIAGDSASTTGSNSSSTTGAANTPYGASIVVSGSGQTRYSQNRVSDFYNETSGSGKITIYMGVGEFYTDQFVTTDNWQVGASLYSNANGLLTVTAGSSRKLGFVLTQPAAYPSGVPGIDVQGSITLGTYLHFAMNVA